MSVQRRGVSYEGAALTLRMKRTSCLRLRVLGPREASFLGNGPWQCLFLRFMGPGGPSVKKHFDMKKNKPVSAISASALWKIPSVFFEESWFHGFLWGVLLGPRVLREGPLCMLQIIIASQWSHSSGQAASCSLGAEEQT